MNKEFVPYEQALALKELGFDEPCFGYYNYNGSHFFKYKPKTDDKNLTKAPLYQQAFRWFREKYGLFVAPNVISYEGGPWLWTLDINSLPLGTDLGGTDDYETYEEAELECLKKLVEIVKNR